MTAQNLSFARFVLLAFAAFVIALAIQVVLVFAGVVPGPTFRLLVTPLIGGVVVYFGLWGYPRPRRARMAVIIAAALFVAGLFF